MWWAAMLSASAKSPEGGAAGLCHLHSSSYPGEGVQSVTHPSPSGTGSAVNGRRLIFDEDWNVVSFLC